MTAAAPFGALSGMVKRCRKTQRPVYAGLIAGAGAGKTLGALKLAQGIVGEGGMICLISAGENTSEELYSGETDFLHIDLGDPDVVQAAKAWFGRGRISWEGDGVDMRIARFAVEQIAPGLGANGVLIFDSISPVWEGTKCRVDLLSNGTKKSLGDAWQVVGAEHELLWRAIEAAPCHRLICIRARTDAEIIGEGKARRTRRIPTRPMMRTENTFRTHIRFWIDSDHVARVEGKFSELNGAPPLTITPAVGARVVALQAPDEEPAEAPNETPAGPDDAPAPSPDGSVSAPAEVPDE